MEETVVRQLPLPEKSIRTRRFRQKVCIRPIGGDFLASILNPNGIRAKYMGKQRFPHGSRGRLVEKDIWSALEPVELKVVQPDQLVIVMKPGKCFTK